MNISEFLSPADVLTDFAVRDKRHLLRELSRLAAPAVDVPSDLILNELVRREELGSTGTGGGIAIPHARVQGVKTPFGVLARLQKPIDFNAIDGQPVDIVFLLLLPAVPSGEQLNALASVARRLRDPDAVRALRGASDHTALHRAMADNPV
jgi:PTS system nitrogen regulatory IIA component